MSGRLPAASAARMRSRPSTWQPTLAVEDDSWSARLHIDADDVLRAVSQALDVLEVSGPVVQVDAMTAEEAERQLASPTLPDPVGILDIQELAGLRTKQRPRTRSPSCRAFRARPSRPEPVGSGSRSRWSASWASGRAGRDRLHEIVAASE